MSNRKIRNSASHSHCVAAGAQRGQLTFENQAESTSFVAVGDSNTVRTSSTVQVRVKRVDDVVPRNLDVFLFKTDTQGFELDVLKGAENLLDSRHVFLLVVEFSYGLLTRAGVDPNDLLTYIYDLGYVCSHMAYHTLLASDTGVKKYAVVNRGEATSSDDDEFSLSFHDFIDSLRVVNGHQTAGVSGWTDLICWQPWVH